jgi:hypothetical protein
MLPSKRMRNQKLTSAHAQTTQMTPVGFEPTQLALVELESTPLDHSGKVSY